MPKLVLRPNQLLTRRDILILSPPQSLLVAGRPWGNMVEILYEHGFKVRQVIIPYSLNEEILRHKYQKLLDNKHVFIDEHNYIQTLSFWKEHTPNNATLTILESRHLGFNMSLSFTKQTPSFWNNLLKELFLKFGQYPNLQKMIPFYWNRLSEDNIDLLLRHCQHLAELDFDLE